MPQRPGSPATDPLDDILSQIDASLGSAAPPPAPAALSASPVDLDRTLGDIDAALASREPALPALAPKPLDLGLPTTFSTPMQPGPSYTEVAAGLKSGAIPKPPTPLPPMRPAPSHGAPPLTLPSVATADLASLPTARPTPSTPDYTVGGVLGDAAVTGLKGAIGVPEAAVGLADIATGGYAGKLAHDYLKFQPKEAKAFLDTLYSPAQQAAFDRYNQAHGVIDKAIAALSNPSVIAHNVLESAPGMLGGMGVGRMAGAVLPAYVAGAIGEGVVQTGQAAEQSRQESPTGLISPRQSMHAIASGVTDTALSALSGKIAGRLGIADVDTMLVAGAGNQVARRGLVKQVIYGAAQEGLLEELPQSVQEQVHQNWADGKPWDEGVDDAAVMGTLAGVVMGGGANVLEGHGGAEPPAAGDTTTNNPSVPPPPDLAGETVINPAVSGDGDTIHVTLPNSGQASVETPAAAVPTSDPLDGAVAAIDAALGETIAPAPETEPANSESEPPVGETIPPVAETVAPLPEPTEVAPPASSSVLDTLDTGETQPRLPGAEDARKVGQADTTFKAPQQASGDDFTLSQPETPEARAAREKAEAPDLFGPEGVESPHAGTALPGPPPAGDIEPIAPGRGARTGDRRRAEAARAEQRAAAIQQRAERHYPDIAAEARANGFAGTDDELRARFNDHVRAARELIEDLHGIAAEHGPDALVADIKRLGGLRPFDTELIEGTAGKRKLRGDFSSLVESFKARGLIGAQSPFRTNGKGLDQLLQELHQDGKWGEITDDASLRDMLERAGREQDADAYELPDVREALGAAGLNDPHWWADASFDIGDATTADIDAAIGAAPNREPVVFRSGTQRAPADMDGYIQAGQPVGFTQDATYQVRARAARYARSGGKVFIDSGAFGNPDLDFTKVLKSYDEFLNHVQDADAFENVYVVAPDKVGDAAATRELQERYEPQIAALQQRGAHVIVPVQVSPSFSADLAEAARVFPGAIFGIPGNKAALPLDQLSRALDYVASHAQAPAGFHLLGMGERNRQFDSYVEAIHAVFPDAAISADSNRAQALFQPGRPATIATEQGASERVDGDDATGDTTELTGAFYDGDLSSFSSDEQAALADSLNVSVDELIMASGNGTMQNLVDLSGLEQSLDLALFNIAKNRMRPAARTDVIAQAEGKPPANTKIVPVKDEDGRVSYQPEAKPDPAMFKLKGPELTALAESGNAAAQAEIDRRAAKKAGKKGGTPVTLPAPVTPPASFPAGFVFPDESDLTDRQITALGEVKRILGEIKSFGETYREQDDLKLSLLRDSMYVVAPALEGHAEQSWLTAIEKIEDLFRERAAKEKAAKSDTPVTHPVKAFKDMTTEEKAAAIMAEVEAEQRGEAPTPAAPTLAVGARVEAEEGTGEIHNIQGDNAKIRLDPEGKLSQWIPLSRIKPTTGMNNTAAALLRRRLSSFNNLLKSKLTPEQHAEVVADIATIEDKLLKVDGLPDGYVLINRDVKAPIPSPDAASIDKPKKKPVTPQVPAPWSKHGQSDTPVTPLIPDLSRMTLGELEHVRRDARSNRNISHEALEKIDAAIAAAKAPVSKPSPVKTVLDDIDARKAANKAKRDAAIAQLKANLKNNITTGVDPANVMLMVTIIDSYIDDGVQEFRRAVHQFQEDFGPGARALDRHFEIAWRKFTGEEGRVADVLTEAQNEPGGTDGVSDDGTSGGPGDASADDVAGEQPGAQEDAPAQPNGRGKRRAPRRGKGDRGRTGTASEGDDARGSTGSDSPANVGTSDTVDDPDIAEAHGRGEAPRHYVITGTEQLTEGGWVTKLNANMDALKLLKQLQRDGRMATADEQAVLAKYIGWGHTNLAPIVDPRGINDARDPRQKQARQELENLLTADELRELGESTANAHYSFHDLPVALWNLVDRLGFKGGSVLEPAVGTGHFFGTMPEHLRQAKQTRLFGVDKEPVAAAIARQLYQGASIQNAPLQEAKLPSDYFDLAISNVPFGQIEIFDPAFVSPERRPLTKSIHNYYFAKAIDSVRPGGLIVFITSSKTMDAKSDTIRQYVEKRAKLLGAVRLTDTAFGKTAGTAVVADVIVLQKRMPGDTAPSSASWMEAVNRPELNAKELNDGVYFNQNDVVWTNEYWKKHKAMVLGTENRSGKMNNAPFQYNVQGEVTPALLAKAIERFTPAVYEPAKTPPRKLATPEAMDAKQGSFILDKGHVYVHDKGTLVPSGLKGKALERVKLFIPLRDAYGAVLDAMYSSADDAALAKAQAGLKAAYDAFVAEFGLVNLPHNRRVIEADPNAGRIVALEDVTPIKTGKGTQTRYELARLADIFSKRTVIKIEEPASAGSPQDALVQSLAWRGNVDLDYMARLTGQPAPALIAALNGEIFHVPGGDPMAYVAAEEYLSGDVVTKLAQAEAAAGVDPAFAPNAAALRTVQPRPLESDEFDAPFGATWVPAETYQAFLNDVTKSTSFTVRLVNHEQKTKYYVTGWGEHEFKPEGMDVAKWAEAALDGQLPVVKWKDDDGNTHVDEEATEELRESLAQLREQWAGWWQDQPDTAAKLTDIYNAMFNREVARQFDGSRLVLPNASPDIKLRPWQKNVIWRILQSGNTLIAHSVGAGKTFAMIGASGEMKRLGLAKKPVIVVPNHLIEQWRRDYLRMYPSARVLLPGKNDFDKRNRQRLIARIANNEWDAVIMAQSQFLRVAVSMENLQAFIKEQEDMLLADGAEQMGMSVEDFNTLVTNYAANDKAAIKALSGRNVERSTKDIVRAIMRLRARLQKRLDQQKKDAPVEFEQLGVDALMVDEAHMFKNLYFSSSLNGIVGLKGSDSDRALDMYLKVRMINRASNNRNVIFATGTPVANVMSELYTQFRYLAQDTLDRLGMAGFDAWKSSYATAVAQSEPAPEGGYKERIRLRDWSNLKQLSALFRRFTDVVGTEDLKKARIDGKPVLELPTLKGGAPTVIALEPHPDMPRFMGEIKERIEALKEGNVDPKDDNHLKISTEASLAAIDMRLVNPHAPDDPNSRVAVAAREIATRYTATAKDKLTQLVFLDVGVTPAKQLPPLPATVMGAQAMPVTVAPAAETDEDGDALDAEGAADAKAGDIMDEEAEHEEVMSSVARFMHGRDLYGDLVQKLVAKGVKRDEIAFIHQATTPYEQGRLFEAMNEGRIRVLIATTGKGGVGMNVQKRLVAMHHLDVPWRPADMEQREGRILRQGNQNAEVEIVRYVTKRSFDEYRWGVLAAKQGFIGQLLRGEVHGGSDEDTTQVDMEVASALSSGDPKALQIVNLERELKGVRRRKVAFERKRQNATRMIAQREASIVATERMVEKVTPLLAAAKAFAETPVIDITHGKGYSYTGLSELMKPTPADMSTPEGRATYQAHIEALMVSDVYKATKFATAGPFNLWIAPQTEDTYEGGEAKRRNIGGVVTVTLATGNGQAEEMLGSSPSWNAEKPPDYARSAMAYLRPDRIQSSLNHLTERIEHLTAYNVDDQRIADKTFGQDAELEAKEAELAELRGERNADVAAQTQKKSDDEDGDDSGGSVIDQMAMGGRPATMALPVPYGTPATPTEAMRPSEIIKALQKGLGDLPVNVGNYRERAWGIFKGLHDVRNPGLGGPDAIRVKRANDLPVIFHEMGHFLDKLLGINLKDARWKAELEALGLATVRPSDTLKTQRKEGAAEFAREYLTDPAHARHVAPAYAVEFEAQLATRPQVLAVVKDAQQRIQGYLSQDYAKRGEMKIDWTSSGTPQSLIKGLTTSPRETVMKRLLPAFRQAVVDDLAPLQSAVEAMRDGRDLPFMANAWVLARLARGASAKAEAFLTHGVRGRGGKFIGPSLADALAPVHTHLQEFGSYLVGLRVVELMTSPDRAKAGKLIEHLGISLDEGRAMVAKARSRADYADFVRARDNVYAYNTAMLEYLRQSHALNAAQLAAIQQMNQNYVPFSRVKDAGGSGRGRGSYANQGSPIKTLRGGGEDIYDPFSSMVANTFKFVEMAEKNKVMLALTNLANRARGSAKWLEKVTQLKATTVNVERALAQLDPAAVQILEAAGVDPDALVTLFDEQAMANPAKRQVTVIRNGEREVWEVHEPALYDAITAVGPKTVSKLIEWMSKPVQLLRAGATLTPGFIARNPTRDTLVAYMQSRYGFLPGYDTLRGILSIVFHDENARLFYTSGVQQAALVGADIDRTRGRDAIARMPDKTRAQFFHSIVTSPTELARALFEGAKHPIAALQSASSLMEEGTRMGEFRLALDAGGRERGVLERLSTRTANRAIDEESLTKATLAARDVTTDFARGGAIAKDINRGWAFFNAHIQGYVRMLEAAQHDWKGVTSRTALLTLLSMALWALNDDDDDYANLPEWERNSYWHIPIGAGTWARIAKPFEWGYVPNMVEAALDAAKRVKGGDPYWSEAFNRMVKSKQEWLQGVWGLAPTAVAPLLEAGANYDSFRDSYIVKPWDDKLDPELQFSDWTSETSKWLGRQMGISPAKIDHVIFGYGAGFSRGIVEGVDTAGDAVSRLLGGVGGKDQPTGKLRSMPLVGTFLRERAYDSSSQDLQDFYRQVEKIDTYKASQEASLKLGDKARARERLEDAKGERFFDRAAAIKAAQRDLKELGTVVKAIYKAPPEKLSPAEKREKLDQVYERMVAIARHGLGRPALRGHDTPVTVAR